MARPRVLVIVQEDGDFWVECFGIETILGHELCTFVEEGFFPVEFLCIDKAGFVFVARL